MTLHDTLPRSVDVATLRDWLSTDPSLRVLDVRTVAEFEPSHIPGALNIPLSQLGEICADVAQRPAGRIVVTCQAGPRSQQAESLLREQGCAQATVLDGGMNAWQAQGGNTEQGQPHWALERQVRLVAGSLVLGGVLGSLRYPSLRFFAGAIGGGLVFAAVSNSCAMGNALSRLPYNQRSSQAIRQAVDSLTAR